MAEIEVHKRAFNIIRYVPNLIRGESLNVGVIVHDAAKRQYRVRIIDLQPEINRVKRLHATVDEATLRDTASLLRASSRITSMICRLGLADSSRLSQTDCNSALKKRCQIQTWMRDLDRLYQSYVEPPRVQATAVPESVQTRSTIRTKASEVFRSTGLWRNLREACALLTTLSRAIRCVLIIPTAATARAGLFKRLRWRAIHRRQKFWRTRLTRSAKQFRQPSLWRSRKSNRVHRITSVTNFSRDCSAKNRFRWCRYRNCRRGRIR